MAGFFYKKLKKMKDITLVNTKTSAPSVSLIVSTDNKYPQYILSEKKLTSLLKKVEVDLRKKFTEEQIDLVVSKLKSLILKIDHKQLSKTLAIFASAEKERIIYLPFSVEEKYIIDSSFEVRDLLYSIKKNVDYLVLLIDSHQPQIYFGYNSTLVKLETNNLPSGTEELERDYPSRVSNFSDAVTLKEINLDKYLRNIDSELTALLNEIDTSVIVLGVKKTLGHFKKITKNRKKITNYIEGNHQHSSKEEIYRSIEGIILEKGEEDQQKTIDSIDQAMSSKQCVYGIENVWRAVAEKRGGELIVEKDYMCQAVIGTDKYSLITEGFDSDRENIMQDAVDDLIELVIENGGDVSFVNNGKLEDYNKIALLTYY